MDHLVVVDELPKQSGSLVETSRQKSNKKSDSKTTLSSIKLDHFGSCFSGSFISSQNLRVK